MIVLCALVRLVLSYLNLLNSDELFTTLHKITESCEISDFSKFCATEQSEKTMLGTKEQPGTNFSHSLQFSSRVYNAFQSQNRHSNIKFYLFYKIKQKPILRPKKFGLIHVLSPCFVKIRCSGSPFHIFYAKRDIRILTLKSVLTYKFFNIII